MTVEGKTEQEFAVQLLQDHLARYNLFMEKPRKASHAKKKGQVHRGGIGRGKGSCEVFKNDVVRWLRQDRDANVYFTTMIDLYALPRSFPGYDEASEIADPYQRVAELEDALSKDIADSRFIPYIQLHEFEALLLSDPGAFSARYQEHPGEIENLRQLCTQYESPELIDDGEQTAPSKRIGQEIPRYLREKSTAAPVIAKQIGIRMMRQRCPHFHQWLHKLETLGVSQANTNT
jgi:hypothetical protein